MAAAIVEKTSVFRKRAWNAAASIVVLGVVASVFLDRANRPDFSDFSVYWVAGGKAAQHRTVYDVQGHYQFKYSPFVALLWSAPVALLPGTKYAWKWLHYAVSGCGWYALFFVFARAIDRRRAFALWLLLVIVFSVGVRDELKLGQANLWPYLLVLPAWFSGARQREQRAFDWTGFAIGAAWGLAVQWKLYALVFAPMWLLRRRTQVFVGAATVTVLTLIGVQSLVHGWTFAMAENVRWLQSLTTSSEELLVSQYNVSLLGTLGKWSQYFGNSGALGVWAYAIWLIVAGAWGAALVWAEREAVTRDSPFLVFWSASWAWSGVLLLNPLVWPYWLTLCVPLFLAYVCEATTVAVRSAGMSFFVVCGLLALMNWLQNFPIVHAGGSLVAVVVFLVDAYRRARARDGADLARLRELPLASPLS